jgi:hypothetical protein
MTVYVVRKSPEGTTVCGPRPCARPGCIAREPGLLTVEEAFAIFLGDGESIADNDKHGRWKILRGYELTGYFEVLEERRTPSAR